MSDESPRSADWSVSSAQTKLARRRIERIVWTVFAVVFALPALLFFMVSAIGPTSGPFALLLTLPLTLFSFLFPIVILLLLLTGVGYTIYAYYNPTQVQNTAVDVARSEPAAGGGSEASPGNTIPASALAALESLLSETREASRRRKRLFIPAGVGIALLLFWMMTSSGGRWHISPGVILLTMLALGAAGGWFMAVARPGKHYARSFKQTLIPQLLTRFGGLTWGEGATIGIDRLAETGILPRYSRLEVDDTITGTYRGYPVAISELTLIRRNGKRSATVFHGLIIEMTVSPAFGFAAVVRDSEAGTGAPNSAGRPLHAVPFDDAAFAEIYSVYGSHEPALRSMLEPAARKALMTMADGKAFHPPLLLCEGSTMTAAIQSTDWRDLLEPSSLFNHDAATQASMLENELAGIFALVDALIALHRPLPDRSAHPD